MSDEKTRPTVRPVRDILPSESRLSPPSDLMEYLRQYARQSPRVVAIACLGLGFVLGWKLKPW